MDHGAVVSRIVEEIKNDGSADFNLDDPFDDPSLVTTAFLDILWQDEHGNAALMLAAAENRVLHVKGILTMAINSGLLWKVIDMRNNDGLNCVQMAVRAGSETSAMLITKVAREYAKLRPRPKTTNETAHESEITFDLGDKQDAENVESGENAKEFTRQSSTSSSASGPPRRINRERLTNNMLNSAQQGHEYLQMVKRSRSAHSRLMSQRTFSVESGSIDSDSHTPALTLPPQDHGVLSSMGERIRSIFGKKPPMHSVSLTNPTTGDRLPAASRSMSTADKTVSYHDSRKSEDDNNVRLPQQSSDDDDLTSMFRNAPWAHSKSMQAVGQKTGPAASSSAMVSTPNGVRLPPLSLRRRANSDPRNREFNSLGDEPM